MIHLDDETGSIHFTQPLMLSKVEHACVEAAAITAYDHLRSGRTLDAAKTLELMLGHLVGAEWQRRVKFPPL